MARARAVRRAPSGLRGVLASGCLPAGECGVCRVWGWGTGTGAPARALAASVCPGPVKGGGWEGEVVARPGCGGGRVLGTLRPQADQSRGAATGQARCGPTWLSLGPRPLRSQPEPDQPDRRTRPSHRTGGRTVAKPGRTVGLSPAHTSQARRPVRRPLPAQPTRPPSLAPAVLPGRALLSLFPAWGAAPVPRTPPPGKGALRRLPPPRCSQARALGSSSPVPGVGAPACFPATLTLVSPTHLSGRRLPF